VTYGFNRRAGDYGKHQRGFTLIELLIAVVIIGIIASIAYPSYTRYVERSVRSDGQTALLQAASEMERCYSRDYFLRAAITPFQSLVVAKATAAIY